MKVKLRIALLALQISSLFPPNPALDFSIPIASVAPPFTRVLDTYQQDITFSCTGTVPKMLVVNMAIIWSVDGVDTTAGVSPISNPMGPTTTSELQTPTLGISGTYNYTCRVIVAVEGDPELQDSASALLDVFSEHTHIAHSPCMDGCLLCQVI